MGEDFVMGVGVQVGTDTDTWLEMSWMVAVMVQMTVSGTLGVGMACGKRSRKDDHSNIRAGC